MRDPEQTPDRRPLVYGIFAVVILLVAAYLFMPESGNDGTDLVLTPESVRQDAALEASASTASMGEDQGGAGALDAVTDAMGEQVEQVAEDDGPAAETHIDDERTNPTSSPASTPAASTPKSSSTPAPASRPAVRETNTSSLTQPGSGGEWVLNVGAFSTRENADRQVESLGRLGIAAHVRASSKDDGSALYRVRVGYFPTSDAAKNYGDWLKRSQSLDSWASKR